MRARPDRGDDLVGLGRREDEPQVGWRLLDQLEQRVEALRGHHVRLVDDVDLVAAPHRREERLLAQLAGVVDTAVGRRVDLDHVDRAGPAAGQVAAAVALPARVGHRRLLAVERAGQDPGAGRLAAAARPGEQVGVVDPVAGERGTERLGHVLLPDDLGEGLGPVAAIERERGIHDSDPRRPVRRRVTRAGGSSELGLPGNAGPPVHPTELTYPCCLPALGELGEMPPHGGLRQL